MHQEREKRRVIVDKRLKTKQVERARRQQQMESVNQREEEKQMSLQSNLKITIKFNID